jgi:hypothetical protein
MNIYDNLHLSFNLCSKVWIATGIATTAIAALNFFVGDFL